MGWDKNLIVFVHKIKSVTGREECGYNRHPNFGAMELFFVLKNMSLVRTIFCDDIHFLDIYLSVATA